jgi:lipopolysaccharide/colanic/teichoic acid biosynthesis glycosyltransferase
VRDSRQAGGVGSIQRQHNSDYRDIEARLCVLSGTFGNDAYDDHITMTTPNRFLDPAYKRPSDLLIVVSAHLLLFPLWLFLWTVIPLSIWLEDRGPIFYSQTRVGRGGKVFRIRKFRSMKEGRTDSQPTLLSSSIDPRVTRVGRIIRRTALDELPQVLSILKGDMTLVGPRPEPPDVHAQLTSAAKNGANRDYIRPGLTGLAQVNAGYNAANRVKIRYDLLYIEKMNIAFDFRLLVRSTLLTVLGAWQSDGKRSTPTHGQWQTKEFQTNVMRRMAYKRLYDVAVLLVGHVVLFPLFVTLWTMVPLAIWIADRGPIFYRQERVGRNGRTFNLIKFRTMRVQQMSENWPEFTTAQDSRVTPVGALLRRLALDELPQTINLWKGQMSLVGPRPLPTKMNADYVREDPRFSARMLAPPGLTGPSQIYSPRHAEASARLDRDLRYLENASPVLDTFLIAQSVMLTLTGRWGSGARNIDEVHEMPDRHS